MSETRFVAEFWTKAGAIVGDLGKSGQKTEGGRRLGSVARFGTQQEKGKIIA
jgi:hypothetical protein